MSYDLHELYSARTNLKLGVAACTRHRKQLPFNVANFWEGGIGMMEHVRQNFPEPNRQPATNDESVVIPGPSISDSSVTQRKSQVATVSGQQNKQVCLTSLVAKNITIPNDDKVILMNHSGTQKGGIECRSLIPSQDESRQDSNINSEPFTKSQGKLTKDNNINSLKPQGHVNQENSIKSSSHLQLPKYGSQDSNMNSVSYTQDDNMTSVSYIVISDDEDTVIEVDIDVNEEGRLRNDGNLKDIRCNITDTKKTGWLGTENGQSRTENGWSGTENGQSGVENGCSGTENGWPEYNLNDQSVTKIINPRHSENTDQQNWAPLSNRGKSLSCNLNNDNKKDANAKKEVSRIPSDSSSAGQSSSSIINQGSLLSSLHHSVYPKRSSKQDICEQLIHEIRETKAKLKILSKKLKKTKTWVEDVDYNQFISFHLWIKEVEFKLKDNDLKRNAWIIAKRALLDFKNMYETIRKNRPDLFSNP